MSKKRARTGVSSRAPGFRRDDGTGDGAVRRKPDAHEKEVNIKLRLEHDTLFAGAPRRTGMLGQARTLARAAWPFVGSLYLLYLAVQAPPVRYVGLVGLACVVPLIIGWVAGRLFDVGPWANDAPD